MVVNLVVNLLLLGGVAALAGTPARPARLLLGAGVGAAYAAAAMLMPALQSPAGLAAGAAAMLAGAFWPVPWRRALAQALILLGLSAATAGLALAWAGLGSGSGFGRWPDPAIWLSPAGAGLAAILAVRLWRSLRRRGRAAAGILDLELVLDEVRLKLRGRVDTGNDASEPLSGLPVVLAAAERVTGAVGPAEKLASDPRWAKRLRLVPVCAVGAPSMLLPALRVDRLGVQGQGVCAEHRGAYVALVPGRLDAGGGFDALVPPELLDGPVPEERHSATVS